MRASDEVPADVLLLIDRFFETPLKLDRNGKPHDIDRSSLRRDEALVLASLVCDLRPKKSLEIGLAEGGSCVGICAARRDCGLLEPHIALDPFQETLTKGAGLLELERLGLRSAVNWVAKRAEDYLPMAYLNEEKFDFVFDDGSKTIGASVVNAFYIDKVLEPDGVIAFHDGLLISTATAVYFLVKERGYTIIPLPADDRRRRLLRSVRYGLRLGWWHSTRVIPAMCRSLVALRKPAS